MAGHSKWANIKHRKGKADRIKGKIFSRITKEIITAVRQGGSDPKSNTRLRFAIQKAREANMPSDNVERNIKKASSVDQTDFASITYELYGYGGVGIIAQIMTDNKNRISSDIRIAVNKKGGTIASPGSVLFNFDQKGILHIGKGGTSSDDLFLLATEAGVDDFEEGEDGFLLITKPEDLFSVKEALDRSGVVVESAELEMVPKVWIECSEEDEKKNQELIDWIEGIDDVDAIYHNMKGSLEG